MSKTKFVNVDEFGNLAASSSSDALLQKVIADLAEYKRTNEALQKNIEELRMALARCVSYDATIIIATAVGNDHNHLQNVTEMNMGLCGNGSCNSYTYSAHPNFNYEVARCYVKIKKT
jgi:hypothetical protein